jgi:hypothetical protein
MFEPEKRPIDNTEKKFIDNKEKKPIDNKEKKLLKTFYKKGIKMYYTKLFNFVNHHLKKEKENEWKEAVINIKKSIFEGPPKFPIATFVPIYSHMVVKIEEEWKKFEISAKNLIPDFELKTNHIPISFSMILQKVHSPPIIACFLGLIIGMSGMREILFSYNHYIYNLVDGIYIVSKAMVPFMYIALGISMLSIKGIDFMKTPINKKYVIISFIMRFIIYPFIGLLYVYLWKNYYGGIDIFIAKFNLNGDREWLISTGSDQNDISRGIIADYLGNIYITGQIGSDENTKGVELIDVALQVEPLKDCEQINCFINSLSIDKHLH